MRKNIKKPLTKQALNLIVSKLNKIANSESEKIEILNNSIMNCWQGIFELKNKPKQFNQPTSRDYQAPITDEEMRMYNE